MRNEAQASQHSSQDKPPNRAPPCGAEGDDTSTAATEALRLVDLVRHVRGSSHENGPIVDILLECADRILVKDGGQHCKRVLTDAELDLLLAGDEARDAACAGPAPVFRSESSAFLFGSRREGQWDQSQEHPFDHKRLASAVRRRSDRRRRPTLRCCWEPVTSAALIGVPDQFVGTPLPKPAISEFIDGRHEIQAHGSSDMPVWGRVLAEPFSPNVREGARIRGDLMLVSERDHPEKVPSFINDGESPRLSFLHLLHRFFQHRRWRASVDLARYC